MTTLKNFPKSATFAACSIVRPLRMNEFSAFHRCAEPIESAEALDARSGRRIVVNLTTPESHFEISRMALEAGKHVYCEKPLAMNLADAARLVELADAKGLTLATAPANALSDAHDLVAATLAERTHRHAPARLCRDGGRAGIP